MKLRIIVDLDVDRPFESAEQERIVLASLEEALQETAIWHELLCDPTRAPQCFDNVRARFTKRT